MSGTLSLYADRLLTSQLAEDALGGLHAFHVLDAEDELLLALLQAGRAGVGLHVTQEVAEGVALEVGFVVGGRDVAFEQIPLERELLEAHSAGLPAQAHDVGQLLYFRRQRPETGRHISKSAIFPVPPKIPLYSSPGYAGRFLQNPYILVLPRCSQTLQGKFMLALMKNNSLRN